MKKFTYLGKYLTIVVALFYYSSVSAKKDKYDINAHMSMRAFSVESEQVNAKVFSYRALFEKEFKFQDGLSAYVYAGFDLQVGSNSSSILAEYAPERQFLLRDAYARWHPFDFIDIKIGALNQGRGRGLLVSRIPFMGAKERLSLHLTKNHILYVELQQSIPNNYFLAERLGVINDEGTPTFFEEKIGVELKGDILNIVGEVSRFAFNDLSSNVAYQSQFIGNSILGGAQENSGFLYKYEGYFTGGRLEMSISDDFGVDAYGQYLFNDGAPDTRNKGHSLTLGLRLFDYGLYVTQFRNESDSSPAFYNSNFFGHNNMEGLAFNLKTYRGNIRDKMPFEFNLEFVSKTPIENNVFQSREDRLFASLTRHFDL